MLKCATRREAKMPPKTGPFVRFRFNRLATIAPKLKVVSRNKAWRKITISGALRFPQFPRPIKHLLANIAKYHRTGKCMLVILASETFLVSPTTIISINPSTSLRCGSSMLPSKGILQTRQKSESDISLCSSYK